MRTGWRRAVPMPLDAGAGGDITVAEASRDAAVAPPDGDRPDRYDLIELPSILEHPRASNEAKIRQLCQYAYLGGGRAICRVLGKYKMFVDPADMGLSMHLMLDGYWEMWVTEAMLRYLSPGMVAADVGANLGYFTLIMSELCGETGRVHAFEPNPAIAPLLQQTLNINGFASRSVVHPVPLSGKDGVEVTLVVPPGEPKNGHIVPAGALGLSGVAITTRRMDGIEGLNEVDFVKIDAEGAEQDIWRGMHRLLDGNRPMTVFLEFTLDRYHDPRAFLEEILSFGFTLSYVDHHRGVCGITVDLVLSGPVNVDWMLVLSR